MLLKDLTNSGAAPTLEAVIRFASQRQRILVHNVANLTTPGFQTMDASVGDFQKALGEAIDARRQRTGGQAGSLALPRTKEITPTDAEGGGDFEVTPQTPSEGVLFHDRTNRSLERQMQALAENAGVFRLAADLWKQQNDVVKMAISQRV